MASVKQEAFFNELLSTRTFPPNPDVATLTAQFKELSQDAASVWIEKALTLPKADTTVGDNSPPPF